MNFILRKSQPREPERRAPPAQILAVASGKGGVGKTWMSITLASTYAFKGKRVLLVDGDLGCANVDIQLGIAPEADLTAVIAGWISLEDAVTPVNGGSSKSGGFDVLPGRSGSGALADLPREEAGRLAAGIAALALRYDLVILDLAAGIDPNNMRLARSADRALVIANDEPTSLTDAYAFIKVMRGSAPSVTPWVAINMADTPMAGRRTYEALARACQTFLGFRPALAGIVKRDDKVREAIRQQRTLPSLHPQAVAVSDVAEIADALMRGGEPHGLKDQRPSA
jgi:flagellar biosynthesis protein FlhG